MEQADGEMSTGQKENNSSEPKTCISKSPLNQAATSHSVLTERKPDHQLLATPPKRKEELPSDPWTPTSNLKLLMRALSPEIRRREQEMELSNTPSEDLQEDSSGDTDEKCQPSRKEKSLEFLCQKFLARYPDHPSTAEIHYIVLDEVAAELTVERRRMYDMLNVLESLHMVSRLAKNRYIWHGRNHLPRVLQALKEVGEKNKYAEQIELIKKREDGHKVERDELPGAELRAESVSVRKDKSLRVMSQKFVMLFLVSTPPIVSLDVAAKVLTAEEQLENIDKKKVKTIMRRLYDITNVLSSLDLMKKVHKEKGRKLAFQWTGPEVLPNAQGTDQNLLAFPSEVAQVPRITKRQLEGQAKKGNTKRMKLSRSALEGNESLPEAVPMAEAPGCASPSQQPALTQPVAVSPGSQSAASPVIQPHPSPHPGAFYTIPGECHLQWKYAKSSQNYLCMVKLS